MRLQTLNLQGNMFTGGVPASWREDSNGQVSGMTSLTDLCASSLFTPTLLWGPVQPRRATGPARVMLLVWKVVQGLRWSRLNSGPPGALTDQRRRAVHAHARALP